MLIEFPIASCALSSVKYLFVEPSETSSVPNVRVPPKDVDVPLIVIAEFESLLFSIDPASIRLVTEPVSPVVTTVPVRSGKTITLSEVGSVTDIIVSKSLAVVPSNVICEGILIFPVNVAPDNAATFSANATVPVASGKVIVRSAVGSVTVRVVS